MSLTLLIYIKANKLYKLSVVCLTPYSLVYQKSLSKKNVFKIGIYVHKPVHYTMLKKKLAFLFLCF